MSAQINVSRLNHTHVLHMCELQLRQKAFRETLVRLRLCVLTTLVCDIKHLLTDKIVCFSCLKAYNFLL